MLRLDRGVVRFNKSIDREPSPGLGMKVEPELSYDYSKAIEAQHKTKERVVTLSNFKKTKARDNEMLT